MHTDLWNHALALYARPGVEAACLDLQALGGDVCLLLCATWLQARGVAVQDERVQALREVTEPWQREVVNPLRSLRQQWRAAAQSDAQLAALREQVKGFGGYRPRKPCWNACRSVRDSGRWAPMSPWKTG